MKTTVLSGDRTGDTGFVRSRLLYLKAVLAASDVGIMAVAFVALSRLRLGPSWTASWDGVLPAWRVLIPLYLLAVAVALWQLGAYRIYPAWRARDEVRRAVRVVGIVAVATLALLYLLDLDDVSRLLVLAWLEVLAVGATASRLALRSWFRRRRARGKGLTHALLIGSGAIAQRFLLSVRSHQEAGVQPLGYLGRADDALADLPHLGDLGDFGRILTSHVVDEVVVCLPFEDWAQINALAHIADEQGKAIRIPIGMLDEVRSRGRLDNLGGMPVLSLVSAPDHPLQTAVKRGVDVLGAAAALLLAAPVMAVIAIAVLVRDGRPVLFRQERVGLHGRRFVLRKFRTMVHGADGLVADLLDANEREGPVFKISEDPRVTPLGRLLRRTSLDELPQLFNVLLGEMSLVGPRPPLPHEVEQYDPWHRRRLSMKPGITGLWQVSKRNDPSWESWVELDLEYIDTWSPLNDVKILLRTIPAVLRMTGR